MDVKFGSGAFMAEPDAAEELARALCKRVAPRAHTERLGVEPRDLAPVLRASLGSEVAKGAILARTGKRFARAAIAPIDGRVVQIRPDGDIEIAPIVGRWLVRSAMDGVVTAADDGRVVVEGEAWCLERAAAYGPDAAGEIAVLVAREGEELPASRIDVRLRGRVIVAGGRAMADAIARAHACGAAAVVAASIPEAGLRKLYGGVPARAQGERDPLPATDGHPLSDDVPTVFLLGDDVAPETLARFRDLDGARAAIHVASARLFVFARHDVAATRS
jgi:hypothetical protein